MKSVGLAFFVLGRVLGDCRPKPVKPQLLQNYPSDHCFRGGVDVWISYDYFPPCWLLRMGTMNKFDCYEYEPGTSRCPPFEGIKDLTRN
ncbi:hypothetical protein DSO57_1013365 [Entomophthora muscae]|uniref:Uncharacterized protein n=1 Tax=Entomophthora muscae TaxID=34485 RepID=A0ACC2RKL5_9FUNG|nr:hypothetical protein DSO57_1013365 [Entomophthora muscae]